MRQHTQNILPLGHARLMQFEKHTINLRKEESCEVAIGLTVSEGNCCQTRDTRPLSFCKVNGSGCPANKESVRIKIRQ